MLKTHWHYILAIFMGFIVLVTLLILLTVALIYPKLPSLDTLTNYQPKIPMRVFTVDGALITADVNLIINNEKYLKAKSKNGNSFIEKSPIDIDKELSNGLIVIEADNDLKLIDSENWEDVFNSLDIQYLFEGGIEKQSFKLGIQDIKYKSNSGRIIVTKKYIVLKIK